MGTCWNVRAILPPGVTAASVDAAIVARLDKIVAEMSHWSPTSLLSRFNRSAGGRWATLPPDFAHVISEGLAIAKATSGAFDPAIGWLVDLHGFGPEPADRAPTAAEIAAARESSGWHRLTFTPADRRLHQPGGLSLDLSGIAKGHAVDAVADLLGTLGIVHALVEIGGELVGRGVRPDGQPWWVDLETPPGQTLAPMRIALHGLAVATSGDYRRGSHTIDPRTGWPTANGVVSASVIHISALAADAWATALTVLGARDGMALAGERGLAARILTLGEGGILEHISPALIAMLTEN
ncbi:thiamine biosynthesis protein ApbE [Sphingomonas sp. Leaf357]|nr:thiamine biosynthesis protein ApbE [Sphingomonas sp. Leaf357]